MAQEINEGIAYLMALKQSSGPAGAAAAAPAADVHPPSASPETNASQQFKGAEKRRSARYKCEGSVQICEEGCDVHTWATFTDISLHGCYVEAQATYPAGTILHMKLEANGIRVETNGNVRVTYPYLGMGIAFVDMSEDNVVQLKHLLAKVSRPCVIMGPGIASSLPATDPLNSIPIITNPEAAVTGLIDFFESRQMLMREDFLRILRKSQSDIKR
jgi:hypothetical protein